MQHMVKEGFVEKFVGLDMSDADTVFDRCLDACHKIKKVCADFQCSWGGGAGCAWCGGGGAAWRGVGRRGGCRTGPSHKHRNDVMLL